MQETVASRDNRSACVWYMIVFLHYKKHNILFTNVVLAGSQKDHDNKDLMIRIGILYDPNNDICQKCPVGLL